MNLTLNYVIMSPKFHCFISITFCFVFSSGRRHDWLGRVFVKVLEDTRYFNWTSGDVSALGFKARMDYSLSCLVTCIQWIPQIHLGLTPADLLVTGTAAEPFLIHILLQAVVGLELGSGKVNHYIFSFWKRCHIFFIYNKDWPVTAK